ncbi:hypothetical protein Tco_1330598, partial [Tanacetum coccineum]
MTHDLPEGVVRFTNRDDEVAYKIPHKIEQYNSLSNLEKEHIKSVYLRNEEDKRRGVDYVMSLGRLGFMVVFISRKNGEEKLSQYPWKWISDKRMKNEAKNDKTEHENGKSVKEKVKVKKSSQPQEVTWERASKTELENLNCQKWAHLYPPSGPG